MKRVIYNRSSSFSHLDITPDISLSAVSICRIGYRVQVSIKYNVLTSIDNFFHTVVHYCIIECLSLETNYKLNKKETFKADIGMCLYLMLLKRCIADLDYFFFI